MALSRVIIGTDYGEVLMGHSPLWRVSDMGATDDLRTHTARISASCVTIREAPTMNEVEDGNVDRALETFASPSIRRNYPTSAVGVGTSDADRAADQFSVILVVMGGFEFPASRLPDAGPDAPSGGNIPAATARTPGRTARYDRRRAGR